MIDFSKYVIEINNIGAVLLAMALQYIFSLKKGLYAFLTIMIATVFMALFLITPALDYMEISDNSPIRVIALALSSLISSELVGVIIKILPNAVRDKILTKLEVKDD